MATIQKFLPFDVSSDANFDAIGKGIYDAIVTTMGWIEKADTGRADWSSNPARPSAGNFLWNIYGPNDALQTGGTVYYVKIYVGLTATSQPQIIFAFGTGTDGSGNLTGVTSGNVAFHATSNPGNLGTVGWECNFSGDTGRLGMMLFRNASGAFACCTLTVERTLASDGTPTSDGVTVVANGGFGTGNNDNYQRTLVFGQSMGVLRSGAGVIAAIQVLSPNQFNNKFPVSPVFPDMGQFGNPMTVIASCSGSDIGEGVIFQTQLYGATRTYVVTGAGPAAWFGAASGSTYRLCMRYD